MSDARDSARPADCSPPQVSIIIPTYNRRSLVLHAIESVLSQRGGISCEIIVVDDGSSDGTADELQARHAGEPRLRVLNSAHRGPSAARNLGFAASRGAWVCFLDSDDRLLPHALMRVRDVFAQHPEVAFVSLEGVEGATSERIVRNNPGWLGARFRASAKCLDPWPAPAPGAGVCLLRAQLFPAVLDGDLFYLSGLFIRRAAVSRAGLFRERYRLFGDWDFHARLCLQGIGALLDEAGFVRGVGSGDQLSRRNSPLRHALMHLRITLNTANSGLARRREDRVQLRLAVHTTRYWLGRVLIRGRHTRIGRRLLLASLLSLYKPGLSLFLLAQSMPHTGLRRFAHGA